MPASSLPKPRFQANQRLMSDAVFASVRSRYAGQRFAFLAHLDPSGQHYALTIAAAGALELETLSWHTAFGNKAAMNEHAARLNGRLGLSPDEVADIIRSCGVEV